jgi:hypothetical protein
MILSSYPKIFDASGQDIIYYYCVGVVPQNGRITYIRVIDFKE